MRITASLFLGGFLAGALCACGSGMSGSNGPGGASNGTATGGMTSGGHGPLLVTTVAGKGPDGEGLMNGDAGTAELYGPTGLAFDGSGNLYVADSSNNAIRRIDANGIVTTVDGLGYGMDGLVNGGPKTAEFHGPLAVAVDSSGNLYVADAQNSVVRRIDTSHNVTTFIPEQTGSFVSSGQGAGVLVPSGIAIDSAGNIYVADHGNNAIRKVNSHGDVSTLVGGPGHVGFTDGDAGMAQFQPPVGLAVDSAGNVYFADQGNNAIRKVDSSGNVSTVAGKGPKTYGFVDGDASTAELFQPYALTVDSSGNLYVADQRNNAIRKIDPQGNVTTLAGRGPSKSGFMDGDAGTAELYYPSGVAVDSSGNVYVGDEMNNAVRKITP